MALFKIVVWAIIFLTKLGKSGWQKTRIMKKQLIIYYLKILKSLLM